VVSQDIDIEWLSVMSVATLRNGRGIPLDSISSIWVVSIQSALNDFCGADSPRSGRFGGRNSVPICADEASIAFGCLPVMNVLWEEE
jgi:hypothetical protein